MVLPQPPLNCPSSSSSTPISFCSSASLRSLLLPHQPPFVNHSFTPKFRVFCCNNNGQETQQPHVKVPTINATKGKRNAKPSFFEQIQDKWSVKLISERDKLPWQEQKEDGFSQQSSVSQHSAEPNAEVKSSVSDPVSLQFPTRLKLAPWHYKRRPSTEELSTKSNADNGRLESHNGLSKVWENNVSSGSGEIKTVSTEDVRRNCTAEDKFSFANGVEVGEELPAGFSSFNEERNIGGEKDFSIDERSILDQLEDFDDTDRSAGKANGSAFQSSLKSGKKLELIEGRGKNRGNAEMAERMLPQHELERLRKISLRMLERFKVGAAGINRELVDSIHEKWKVDEVVKLKFEGPLAANMRRAHEILESRTGGLVVWRSGSSIVIYRGMAYNLPCVQSYNKQKQAISVVEQPADVRSNATMQMKKSVGTHKLWISDTTKYLKDMSEEELIELSDLDQLLDELGPRYTDWLGRQPLPVDADLLPAVVPGYRTPFRLLPHGIRPALRDHEMTKFRHLARKMPPHFAIGRSRALQGLARAMVKLWETNAIAKIAIKRGVENTRNERMAEELKKLTGGTLVSRNKEYIVFYRGNDFLPSAVTEALNERQKQAQDQQDTEEQSRQMVSSLTMSDKASPVPLIAGTLAETMAATSHWVTSGEDVQTMMRKSALTKLASIIRDLENRLALAKGKLTKADKALAKLHEDMEVADLPTDLETITDEERILYRKIGISMKPYLLLGRRGIYSGTVENMHLHWKYREVVKIIAKGKTYAQVKHIAISLEAESGGLLVSVDKTTKGYAIIVYRGKNYLPPSAVRPQSLLTKRQAMARSIELQRREALKYHISDVQERIELLKYELEDVKNGKIDGSKTSYSALDGHQYSDDATEE